MKTRVTGESYVIRGTGGRAIADGDAPDWLSEVNEVQHLAGAGSSEINSRAYWTAWDYEGADLLIPGGYAQIFKPVSDGIDIQLNKTVTDVEVTGSGAPITPNRGAPATFDAVVVTVPLGVLKRGAITFSPPLPQSKQTAIDKLGMGVLDKVYLRYNDVFRDRDATWILTPETALPPGQFNQWLNLAPYLGAPIILAFNGAGPARDLSKLGDAEIIARAQQALTLAYP